MANCANNNSPQSLINNLVQEYKQSVVPDLEDKIMFSLNQNVKWAAASPYDCQDQ